MRKVMSCLVFLAGCSTWQSSTKPKISPKKWSTSQRTQTSSTHRTTWDRCVTKVLLYHYLPPHVNNLQQIKLGLMIKCIKTNSNVCLFSSQTPLHLAVITNQPDVCYSLIVSGCDVTVVDNNGDTPLHIACRHGNLHCFSAITQNCQPEQLHTAMATWNYNGENKTLKCWIWGGWVGLIPL